MKVPRLKKLSEAYEEFKKAEKKLGDTVKRCFPEGSYAYYSRGKQSVEVQIISHGMDGLRLYCCGPSGRSYWVHWFRFLNAR